MEAKDLRSLKVTLGKIENKLDKVLEFIQERPEPKKSYSVKEASELLSIDQRQVRRLLDRGEIASLRVGRRRFIPSESLARYQIAVGLIGERVV